MVEDCASVEVPELADSLVVVESCCVLLDAVLKMDAWVEIAIVEDCTSVELVDARSH